MSSPYDASEFIDGDFQAHKSPLSGSSAGAQTVRAPSREEVDAEVAARHQRLSELKREQEALERERAALEETRRRQTEFQTGLQEMTQNLTRGLGLLEQTEFNCRRDAEQLAKAVSGLREAFSNLEAIHQETWTKDNFNGELTRALTTLENARMEWNAARLKFPVLSAQAPAPEANTPAPAVTVAAPFGPQTFGELCRIGFALTWPLALVALAALGLLAVVLLRR
jgi:chromosome segregation ATPase